MNCTKITPVDHNLSDFHVIVHNIRGSSFIIVIEEYVGIGIEINVAWKTEIAFENGSLDVNHAAISSRTETDDTDTDSDPEKR